MCVMSEVDVVDPTDTFNYPLLLLAVILVILCLCFFNVGCIQVDKTGFRAGIIDSSDSDDNGVEVHQRSCTGISVLW